MALVALIGLVVASPWAFGGAPFRAARAGTLIALIASLAIVLALAWQRRPLAVARIFWPGMGFLILGGVQLLPLPRSLHAAIAPGSARFWYPSEPAAAAILGEGPRPVSINPPATRRALTFGGGVLILALLASPALGKRRAAVTSVLVVSGGAVALTLYALLARLLLGRRLYGVLDVPTVAPFGPFVSKNHFAGYTEMACLLVLGLSLAWSSGRREALAWIESRRAHAVMLAGGGAAVLALGVLVSLSRGGALSLAGGVLVLFVLRSASGPRSRKRRIITALGLAVLLGGAALVVLPSSGRERLRRLPEAAEEGAGAFRLRTWSDTLRLSASSLLVGTGLGTFSDALAPFKSGSGELRVENAENDYLQVLAEMGVLGMVLVATGLWQLFAAATSGLAGQRDRTLRGLGLGALAGLAAIAIHSAFDFNLRLPSNLLLAVFLLALTAAAAGPVHVHGRSFLGALVLGLVVALSLAAADPHPTPPARTLPSPTDLRVMQAEDRLRAELRRRPGDAESWVRLGWVRRARGSPREGAALARYGAALDPRREALRAAADALAVRLSEH